MEQAAPQGVAPATPVNPVAQEQMKALRQTGFPDVEAKATPSSLAQKVISALQKRLNKLEDAAGKITDIPMEQRTDLMKRILGVKCLVL